VFSFSSRTSEPTATVNVTHAAVGISSLPSSRTRTRRFFCFFRSKSILAHLIRSRDDEEDTVSFGEMLISIFNALVSHLSARDFIYHKVVVIVVVLPLSPRYDSRIYRTYIESRQCFVCTLHALVLFSLVFALLPFLMSLCYAAHSSRINICNPLFRVCKRTSLGWSQIQISFTDKEDG